ncbi:MAG: SDR family NAD(P)-dependent oxidoreductase [Pseudomonadota bacterium]
MPDSSYPTYHPKVVFITGATGGFGEAFTKRFDAIGAKLILHGRNQEKLEKLAQTLSSECHLVTFDLKDRDGIEKAIEAIPDAFKPIDLLVNNAGGALGLDKFQDAPIDDLVNMIEMNNTSLIRISRLVLPQMVAAKSGHIINIGSIAGNWPYPGGHVYCAVKAFVQQFSLALRSDLMGTNIRVSNIEPGMAETPFSLNRFKGDAEKADAVYANTAPLKAEDIAETVFWTATLPAHVNINTLEVMPTKQTLAAFNIERDG